MIQASRRRTTIQPPTQTHTQTPASRASHAVFVTLSRKYALVCSRKHVHVTTSMQSTGRQAGKHPAARAARHRAHPHRHNTARHGQLKMSMYRFVRSSPHTHTCSHRHMQSLTQMDRSNRYHMAREGGRPTHLPALPCPRLSASHGGSDMDGH